MMKAIVCVGLVSFLIVISGFISSATIMKQPIESTELVNHPWPMLCHDSRHTGQSPYSTEDNLGGIKWVFSKNSISLDSSPVIAQDGTIYIGLDANYLYAINPDGTEKWRWKTDYPGMIRSSPAIAADDTIYIGSDVAKFFALYPNGTKKWTFPTNGYIWRAAPTIAQDGTIYIGCAGSHRYYAINPNGTEKWHFDTNGMILQTAALAADGTVYLSSHDVDMYYHGWLYALNPTDGSLLWQYDLHNRPGSPAVGTDGTIYIPSCDDYLYAFNPDGTLKWKAEIGVGSINSPTIASDGTIYVGEDEFYAINPDGTRKWVYDPGEDWFIDTNAAIAAEGTIYFCADEIWGAGVDAFALNPDGTLRWRYHLGNDYGPVSPAIAPDGTVYAGCNHYQGLYCYTFIYAFGGSGPDKPNPPIITGKRLGRVGETYEYTFVTTDPNGDDVYYWVHWGNSVNTSWIGPYSSGTPVTLNHNWSEKGQYTILAQAMDIHNIRSDFGKLKVYMPMSLNIFDLPLLRLLGEILGWFSNLFPLFGYVVSPNI